MPKRIATPAVPKSLRDKAETQLKEMSPVNLSATDMARIHELHVHQVELEMQNAALLEANSALEAAHNRYLDLYDLAPVGYLTLTQEAKIAEINLTGIALFGIDREQLIQRPFAALLIKEDGDRWHLFFTALIKYGGNETAEFTLSPKCGDAITVRVDCLRVLRDDPVLAVHVALTNISDKKRDETRLREQEEFFRLIAENIDGFIAVLDSEGRRIYNSPSYARLFGERNLAGTDSFADIHPEDCERVKQAFCKTVATGVGQHLEYRFMMPDGRIRLMESRGGLIADCGSGANRVVVVANDVTERYEAEQKIHHLAFYDALTQLPNRLTLNDRLQQAMSASKRSNRYGAVMFLDLDNFKPANDQHGHGAGDQILVQAAARITGCVREIDTVARFGGDEFVVLLGELDAELAPSVSQASMVAEKIREAIAAPFSLQITLKNGSHIVREYHCTASIGIKMFLNHDNCEEEILRLADIAMYRAKKNGRNQISFHSDDAVNPEPPSTSLDAALDHSF